MIIDCFNYYCYYTRSVGIIEIIMCCLFLLFIYFLNNFLFDFITFHIPAGAKAGHFNFDYDAIIYIIHCCDDDDY